MVLQIPFEIWRKLRYYTELSSPNEVTGIGTVAVLDAENLEVTEVFLPRQLTSPAYCEFKEGELNGIIGDLIEQSPERAGQLRFRWHSHGQSDVFWSQKDEQDIASWDASWVVNLVMNVQGKHLCRLDYFQPLRVRNYPVELRVKYPDDFGVRAVCAQELSAKLTLVKLPVPFLGKEL